MVNVGRRSKCCTACRDRRVKCDLQKPYCRRCTQAGRQCPGYPDAWDVMLRMQNDYAKHKVHTRVQKGRTKRTEEAEIEASIPRGAHITAEVHSWNRFHLDYANHSGIKIFNVLPKFYASSSSMCFQEALTAVALASSARQLHQSGLMVMARRRYGRAIVALNAALNDPVIAVDDSVLVTMFLLSLFEVRYFSLLLSSQMHKTGPGCAYHYGTYAKDIQMIAPECFRKDNDFQCHIHFRGSLLLLRWRAERAQDSELDQSFFKFLSHICVCSDPWITHDQHFTDINIQLMSMFLNNEPFDVKWSALANFAAPWTKGPLLEPILERTVDFKRGASEILKTGHPQSQFEVIQLIKDGIIISEDLEAAAVSIKSSANPGSSSFQQARAFNDLFEVSTATTEAIARSLYRTIKYHVIELILGLSGCIKQESDALSHEPDYEIRPSMRLLILDQVCGEIGAVLGPDSNPVQEGSPGIAYRAYGMFWPMLVLLSSSSTEVGKRAWICEMLRLSGKMAGFGLATWTAEKVDMLRPHARRVEERES